MHGATATAATALQLAKHLGHNHGSWRASQQRVPMLTIGSEHRVFSPETIHNSDRNGFLTNVKMKKTSDISGSVLFRAGLFKHTNPHHLLQDMLTFLLIIHSLYIPLFCQGRIVLQS
jgi:hypothetical protein